MAYSDVTVDNRSLPSAGLPSYLSKQYRDSLGALIELTDAESERICNRLNKEIKNWLADTAELRNRLEDWNDRAENVVNDSDFPWVGASNVAIPLIPIFMKVYHSIQTRSILGSDSIWYAETDDEDLQEILPEIENSLNYNARSTWNITEAFRDVFYSTNRDGTAAMQVPYVEEYEENVKDVVYITGPDHFLKEFPNPQESGISPEQWVSFSEASMTATEDDPLEIPVTYDKCLYRGPKGEVVELAQFVIFPATAKDINRADCRGYGKEFTMRKGMVRLKRDQGFWYEDACNKFLKWAKKGSDTDKLTNSKDWIEGLSRGDTSDDQRFYEVVYWMPAKTAGKSDRKLLLTYHYDSNTLMCAIEYPYRVDFYSIFRIDRRPNRLLGVGVPASLMDMADVVDTEFNQRINSRTISHVPSFKAADSLKNAGFDPEADENRFRPGAFFWLPDNSFDKLEQWKIQPVDMGESSVEQQNIFSLADLLLGSATSIQSGRPDPKDSAASGIKTQTMISQSNMRMDDPLQELRYGVEKVGEICLSHMYQFGPAMIKYVVDLGQGQKEVRYLSKSILRKGIKLKMQGITVMLNPEQEFQKYYNYYLMAIKEPSIAQDTKRRTELLRLAFRQGRVPNRDKILPSVEEMDAQQQQQTMAALQQLMAQQKAQQMQMAQQQAKQVMDEAQMSVRRKALAQKIADQNLNFSNPATIAPVNPNTPTAVLP